MTPLSRRSLLRSLAVTGGLKITRVCSTLATTDPTGDQSVAMFRGNPARTGVMPGTGPSSRPELRWATWLGFVISASPVVADGIVYVGSLNPVDPAGGALHAIDAASGEERWRLATLSGDGYFATPAVTGGTLFSGSYDGVVLATDAATGVVRWRYQAPASVYSSPAPIDGVVYLGDEAGNLHALDAATGEHHWRLSPARDEVRTMKSSPAVVDDTIFVVGVAPRVGEPCRLLAVERATGAERWQFNVEGLTLRGTPAVANGLVHLTASEGDLITVDGRDGRERWRATVEAPIQWTNPAADAGLVYLGSGSGRLRAFDAATGVVAWEAPLTDGEAIVSSPAVAGSTLYVGDARGTLSAVDAATGELAWQLPTGSYLSSPVVADGVLYVGGDDGMLRAFADVDAEPRHHRPTAP